MKTQITREEGFHAFMTDDVTTRLTFLLGYRLNFGLADAKGAQLVQICQVRSI